MKALVMGGTRFVGLHLAWELSRNGHDVTVVNRGKTPAQLPAGVSRITCDRKDHASLRKALSGKEYDAVFDIMAYVPEDARPLIDIFDGRTGRFVFVSTGSVYRQVEVFPWKEDFEKVTDNSQGDYGYNKQLIEEMLFEAHARTGFPVVAVRPGYIYGPHNSVYRESLFFDRVVKGRPVVIPGDGSYLECFGYVDDLARLLVLCATREEARGQAFNFAGEFAYPMNDYMEKVFAACGRRVPLVHFRPEEVGMSDADVPKVFPFRWKTQTLRDTSKARYLLGYREQVSLDDGLKHAFRWFVDAGVERKDIDFTLEDRIISAKSRARP